MKKSEKSTAPFDYTGIERVMHEKARLGILSSLYVNRKGHSFNDLKKLCNLTDGNLSRHLKVLKETGLVEIEKGYIGNKPHTACSLTDEGRKRFTAYMAELEKVISDAASAKEAKEPGVQGRSFKTV